MTTRVLLWSPHGAGEHYHGPGSFAYRLYNGVRSDAVSVELAHAFEEQATYSRFAAQHRIAPAPRGAAALARYLMSSRRWLANNVKRFDVMHCLAGFHPSLAPAHRAQRLGLPCVLFVANHRVEFTDKPGLRGLLRLASARRRMVRELSAVVAMSRAIYDELIEIGVDPRRIARIPMGVDVHRFRPASQEERSALRRKLGIREMPTLAFVGVVTQRKRPHLLVQGIGKLHAQGIDCQLVLAGPTPETAYADSIRAVAGSLGVSDLVHWTGHVPRIDEVLRAADFFALPSALEGMPAALVEAMACGLPSIATRISGCEDLIDDGVNGTLVEPDVDIVARSISAYVGSSRLAAEHGAKARARIVETCGHETVLGAYLSLFDAVRTGRDPATLSTVL